MKQLVRCALTLVLCLGLSLSGVLCYAPTILAAIDTWTSLPLYGGDISCLATNRSSSSTLYATSYGGGVFRSADGGGTCTVVNTRLSNLWVESLAVKSSFPATIYAGTLGALFRYDAEASNSLVLSSSWNLVSVSVPLSVSSIPGLQAVYGYHDGWSAPTMLVPGEAYWVQVQNAVTVPLPGIPSTAPVDLSYQADWQLLGNPFDVPLPITSITNHGLITTCYSYGPTWGSVDPTSGVLEPGKGYWIQLSAGTTLTLTYPSVDGGDAFEPDNDPAHASVIATDGSSQHHNFAATGDEDWVKFTAVAGTTYTIDTLNAEGLAHPFIELLAPDGTTFIDQSYSYESRIDFECPAGKGGTYYVRFWNEYGDYGLDTGYDLRIQPALQVSFSDADNAGKDYGLANVLNHVTVTVTRGGLPVAGASVNVDYGTSTLTTNASGQASFTCQRSNRTRSYLQVTSGTSKVTGASFWVIDPSSALMTVKPRDINGYYLTRFYMDAWNLVNGSGWLDWGSGTSNTFTLPVTVSASNLAVVTAPSDQHGGGGYLFTLHPTLTAGQKTVLTPLASTDCVALSLSATLNGSALTNGYVYLRNQGYASTTSSYAARTNSSGNSITYVTPGFYTAVVKKNNYSTPSVWLMKKDILADSAVSSSIAVTTAQLGTLTVTGRDGSSNPASDNYLYLESEGISTYLETTPSNSTLLFSPGTYQELHDEMYLYPSGTSEGWYYRFDCSATHTVTAGSTASVTFGGPLTMTVNTPSSVIPGQNVTTKLTVADPQGHRLYSVQGYTDMASPASLPGEPMKAVDPVNAQSRPMFTTEGGIDVRPPIQADAWGYVYPNPHLVITDPTSAVKIDRQDVDVDSSFWSGYSWTVPVDATAGTWHAAFTFDPGVYQGVVSVDQPFTVSP